jgi:ABC-type multidrug transport system ATPase subunit
VSKLFGRFPALREVSGSFPAGRLYVVLGENGAGKSTLLRVLAGLAEPSAGEALVLGGKPRAAAARLGYMAHASLLYDEMTALENLRYFTGLYGLRGDGRPAAAMQAVGLDPALDRRVGQYSQGMRQRLSLARAALHDPELLLLDEPFSNVDASSAQQIVAWLGAARDAGRTLFVVTHQPALLEPIADEWLQMAAGSLARRSARAEAAP